MTKILSCIVCVVAVVLAVSVWRQLQPTTQQQIVMLWGGLVEYLAHLVEQLVAAIVSA